MGIARSHLSSPGARALAFVLLAIAGATLAVAAQYIGPCSVRHGPVTSTGSVWQLGAAVGGSLSAGLFAGLFTGLSVHFLARKAALASTPLETVIAFLASTAIGIGVAVWIFLVAVSAFLDRCPPSLS